MKPGPARSPRHCMSAFRLTPREIEIVALVERGFDASGIAKERGIDAKTVRASLVVIREKLRGAA